MNICFISNDSYIEYLATIIVSILDNSLPEDEFNFYVIDDGISQENKNKIDELKKIKNFSIKYIKSKNKDKYIEIDKKLKARIPTHNYHYSVFYKLDIPIIFYDLDYILFLDIDMIVTTRLHNYLDYLDINNYCIAVQENYHNYFGFIAFMDWMRSIGLDPNYNYLLGGLIYFNLKLIRETMSKDDILNSYKKCESDYSNIVCTEEHVLLYTFRNSILFTNFDTSLIDWAILEHNKNKPFKIIHFDGQFRKPLSYNFDIKNYDIGYNKFWKYFFMTPFFIENPIKYINIYLYHRDLYNLEKYNSLECKLNIIDNNTTLIINILKHIINSIAWWIPIKSLRNSFRAKFKIADQTRPDQTRPNFYTTHFYIYNNTKNQKLQPMLQYTNAA